jgi:hypothetical protein
MRFGGKPRDDLRVEGDPAFGPVHARQQAVIESRAPAQTLAERVES